MNPINLNSTCGNCNGKYKDHFFVNGQEYCYSSSTLDVFTDEPNILLIVLHLQKTMPEVYGELVEDWKRKNGHLGEESII